MTAEELAQMTRLRRPLEAEHWRGVLNVLAILKHDPACRRAMRRVVLRMDTDAIVDLAKKEGLVEFAGLDLLRLGTKLYAAPRPKAGLVAARRGGR